MKRLKKILSVVLAAALLAGVLPVAGLPSFAAEIVDSGTCGEYSENQGKTFGIPLIRTVFSRLEETEKSLQIIISGVILKLPKL